MCKRVDFAGEWGTIRPTQVFTVCDRGKTKSEPGEAVTSRAPDASQDRSGSLVRESSSPMPSLFIQGSNTGSIAAFNAKLHTQNGA